MKKVHRNRLRKLADYLDTVPRKKFDMKDYCINRNGGSRKRPGEAEKEINNCGTVACAAGHGAVLFPRIARRHTYFDPFIDDCFGLLWINEAWSFIFSDSWVDRQPTPKQAARRIRLFLDKGLPKEWNYSTPVNKWVWG